MNLFLTEQPMASLSQQQKQEAEQLFYKALQYTKDRDYVSAAEYYGKSAEYGHPGSQNNLGHQYKNGRGVNKNPQEAFRLFLESARHGSPYGMRNVATCYQDGFGTVADFDTAIAWLMTAAEQKDNMACAMLALAYDNWNHKDEEKKLYWHNKAAEYGNSGSMFFLGEYYATKGDNQNLAQASYFYDSAAKAGTPEMKLKVAKAFDKKSFGAEEPLSLENAKIWYTEVLSCDNENLYLDAAKGLDELSDDAGNILRPALDIVKAYTTYRALAAKDNKEACCLSAYCSEVGKGTSPNIDIAIMLYEKAQAMDVAAWCKQKKMGDMSDHIYMSQRGYQMPLMEPNTHSYSKELYNCDINTDICAYNGRIYYLSSPYSRPTYLCSSNFDGNDIKILSEENEYNLAYVHVNMTGIYLYSMTDYDHLFVKHIGFDGRVIGECKEKYDHEYEDGHQISNIYFYDNIVYFVYEHKDNESSMAQIKCMHVDNKKIDLLYDKASSIKRLFATDKKLIFLARYEYENEDCTKPWADGWMILDLVGGNVECISNPYCNPEDAVNHPEIYDEENISYNDKCNYDRKIVFFDLNREIFWTERTSLEGTDSAHLTKVYYWEPKSLWKDRDKVIHNMPVWRMMDESSAEREYFDGTYHYYSKTYYVFKSSDVYGKSYKWSSGNGGHGECSAFKIIGSYMFLNIAAHDEEQYKLTVEKSVSIRKSWFKEDVPKEAIELYSQRDKAISNIRTEVVVAKDSDLLCNSKDGIMEEPMSIAKVSSDDNDIVPNVIIPSTKKKTGVDGIGAEHDLYVEKKIGDTDINYHICTFGSKFHIGFGLSVTIKINGNSYQCKTHNTAKGRIDGMKKLYAENSIALGDVLKASYSVEYKTITIEKM